jgi:hypothetical protein
MKISVALITVVLGYCGTVALAEEHSAHSTSSNQEAQLNQGKKWETDKPLRKGMEKISLLAKKNISAIHNEKLTPKAYVELGNEIKAQTDLIFKNCKLPPTADQELHKILFPILNSVTTFTGKGTNKEKHEAFVALLNSLAQYGSHFEHKNWSNPE